MDKVKVRFAFHSPKGERGIGKAIVALTWFYGLFYNWKVLKYNFSHEEIWLPDKDGNFTEVVNGKIKYLGKVFSSTTRGKANGVRFANAQDVLGKHPQRWKYIEGLVDPERLEVALDEARLLVGRKYDFWGILGFLNPFPIQHSKQYYCSELCNWFRVLCGISEREKRISPRRSAYKLAKVFGEPKPI